jgi:hypothetical protein
MRSTRTENGSISLVFLFLMAIIFVTVACIEIIWYIQFDRNCEGYLKRAAYANTIEFASKELDRALKYLENNGLTTGYTSVLYTTPDEDMGFFYTNLKQSLEELKALPPNASGLEKSNMLIKLRETILDEGKSASVTCPFGISRYPYNTIMGILFLGSLVFGCILVFVNINEY